MLKVFSFSSNFFNTVCKISLSILSSLITCLCDLDFEISIVLSSLHLLYPFSPLFLPLFLARIKCLMASRILDILLRRVPHSIPLFSFSFCFLSQTRGNTGQILSQTTMENTYI
jgi:hypothetical protein